MASGALRGFLVQLLALALCIAASWARPQTKSTTALVLFQHNEHEVLGDWLRYHAAIFGFERIWIIDHSSKLKVVKNWLRYAEKRGSHVVTFEGSFKAKNKKLTEVINSAFASDPEIEFVIPIDADEFIIAEDGDDSTFSTDPEVILQHFAELPRDGWKYKFKEMLAVQCPKYKLGLSGSERRVTHSVLFNRLTFDPRHKTFFFRDGFIETDPGNHRGKVENDERCEDVIAGTISGVDHVNGYCFHITKLALVHYGVKALSFASWKAKNARGARVLGFDTTSKCGGPGIQYCKAIQMIAQDEAGTKAWFEETACQGALYYSEFMADAVYGDRTGKMEYAKGPIN